MSTFRTACAVSLIAAALAGLASASALMPPQPTQPTQPVNPPAVEKPAVAPPPGVGDKAIAFKLNTIDEPAKTIALADLIKDGPVVLAVLRGWPGYQCPICTRQVQGLMKEADTLKKAGAKVVLVYPGPSDELRAHGEEFIAETDLPDNFVFVIDPDYTFTNAWRLRWDSPKETAYPSTFVIGIDNIVRYAKVSKTHGGRAATEDVLKAVEGLQLELKE